MSLRWHILTGEYPPASGGVGDYTARLADALAAAGDIVTVWTPGQSLPDRFGRKSQRVLRDALSKTPGIVLLQYVPNALGARGLNLPFCLWLRGIARGGADVRVMFHEPYFYFTITRPWRNALALVQRAMAHVLLDAASRTAYISTETWRRYLTPRNGSSLELVPIPSNITPTPAADATARHRRTMAPAGQLVVGHFGTYGDHVERELLRLLPALAGRCATARFAFIGDGSDAFLSRLTVRHRDIAARSWASGTMHAADVSAALRACDVLVQPYPDGITTRRTSAMAGLQHGVPMVTTSGALTEAVWAASAAVSLIPAGDVSAFANEVDRLLRDRVDAQALATRGAEAYERYFSLERTLAILRGAPAGAL